MVIINIYDIETIQRQTKYRRTADIMAVILRIVIGGEGTKRRIANGANLSFSWEADRIKTVSFSPDERLFL